MVHGRHSECWPLHIVGYLRKSELFFWASLCNRSLLDVDRLQVDYVRDLVYVASVFPEGLHWFLLSWFWIGSVGAGFGSRC